MKVDIAIVGYHGVGKKKLISKYTGNHYDYPTTFEGIVPYFADYDTSHGKAKLVLWYVSPHYLNDAVQSGFFKLVDGIIFMGSFDSVDSYDPVQTTYESIKLKYKKMPILFVNNKQDLYNEKMDDELADFIVNKNKYPYIPISLKTGFNENKPMNFIVDDIIHQKYLSDEFVY